ncbi:hypothetical protein SAMD00019534_101690 [Acytostelium subglobosum LB1]|uniref:hypothetical protein n=1 Tax=Acytostelium subglobosum LB1 TaxID=1410327 RepID=UPI000644E30A|nr:hypothetical protein SAMD00019534_101690 [Acytostelium subglobosum LB1]GAM26994.1 hypothetical protein SAMD00019534_101690 [Acytostelium subglobosum LB1]|eukprot:XP_012749874.1 hypothetical protein SAMD00019534_101690 [Acytostelium subglobosum LB1]
MISSLTILFLLLPLLLVYSLEVPNLDTSAAKGNDVHFTIYNDTLDANNFYIPLYSIVTNSNKQSYSGNYSIEFIKEFYIFTKTDSNFTIDKREYSHLTFYIYPTHELQDLTLTLINDKKEEHSIPIINALHPINSVLHTAYLTPNQWTKVQLSLEYFPSNSYRGLWFVQKHPTYSIFIDDIKLKKRDVAENEFKVYANCISGVGVLVQDVNGIKLNSSNVVYNDHVSSIQFDLQDKNRLYIEFRKNIVTKKDTQFVFHIYPDKSIFRNDVEITFVPSTTVEPITKYNLSSLSSPTKPIVENSWNKIGIHVPKSSYSGMYFTSVHPLTESTLIYLDNIYVKYAMDATEVNQSNNSLVQKKKFEIRTSLNILSQFFPFFQVNFHLLSSVPTIPKAWATDFPSVSFTTSNREAYAKASNLTFNVNFNNSKLAQVVGKDKDIPVLYQKVLKVNQFQFLNLNFSFPTSNFFLVVGSLDLNEEVFVSATTPVGGGQAPRWRVIDTGFLFDGYEAYQVKIKMKNQGLYLSAKKALVPPPQPNPNFIVLQPLDPVNGLTFSVVSDTIDSDFFFTLYAINDKETNALSLGSSTTPAFISTK